MTGIPKKVWFERPILDTYLPKLNPDIEVLGPGSSENPLKDISEARALVVGGLLCDAELLKHTPNALMIVRLGIGYDRVNVDDLTRAGVALCNTPEGPTISTAECALSLMMSVSRRIKYIENELIRSHETGESVSFYSIYNAMELYERQLGLVGLGRIGSHVARVAQALGMKVAAYDPYLSPEKAASAGIQLAGSLEELLGMSDVVSLHLPLTDENYQFMNAERFAQMKPGSIFINTARGGHVDEKALVDALDSGHLFGAGLDVTDPEPLPAGSPLYGRSNVVITPHIASATVIGKLRIYEMAMEEVMRVLRGDRPRHLVNPEVWDEVAAKWQAQAGE